MSDRRSHRYPWGRQAPEQRRDQLAARTDALIKKRRAAMEALRELLATLQSEKRALDQAWAEYDAVISPDQTALMQAIRRHKDRLLALGVTNATLDELDDTPETLRLLREFADEKEAEPAPVTSQTFSEIDRLLSDAVAQSQARSEREKGHENA